MIKIVGNSIVTIENLKEKKIFWLEEHIENNRVIGYHTRKIIQDKNPPINKITSTLDTNKMIKG